MATAVRLTITELVASIKRQFETTIPVWKMRRVVDSLEESGSLDVQRVANYRTIEGDDVGKVAAELQRLGWLPKAEVVPC